MGPDLEGCTSAIHLCATFSAYPNIAQLVFELPGLSPFAHIRRCLGRYEALEREMKSATDGDRLDGRLVVDRDNKIIPPSQARVSSCGEVLYGYNGKLLANVSDACMVGMPERGRGAGT